MIKRYSSFFVLCFLTIQSIHAADDQEAKALVRTLKLSKASPVNSLAISGEQVVSGYEDGKMRVWDIESGSLVREIQGLGPAKTIAAEGTRIILGYESGITWLQDIKSDAFLSLRWFNGEIKSVAISPDLLVLASSDKKVMICESTGEEREISDSSTLYGWIKSIAISHDQKTIALGDVAGAIYLLKLPSYEISKLNKSERTCADSIIKSLAFDSKSKTLLASCGKGTIALWDIEEDKRIALLQDQEKAVKTVRFSPDDNLIISGGVDGLVKIRDAKRYALLKSLKGHKDKVNSVVTSPDGKYIASGSEDGTIKVWDVGIALSVHADAVKGDPA